MYMRFLATDPFSLLTYFSPRQPTNLRSIAFPEDTTGLPIRFTRVHAEDDLIGTSRTFSSDQARTHDCVPSMLSLKLLWEFRPLHSTLRYSCAGDRQDWEFTQ